MIDGKKTRLIGTYSSGTISAVDIKQETHEVSTTFFIAQRVTEIYTFPQHQAGFLCVAPLDPKYDSYNFVSNLKDKKKITTESFIIQTEVTGYEKYKGQFLVGFDPQSSSVAHQANDYKIYIADVKQNLGKNPKDDIDLQIIELGEKLVKDV